MKNGSSSFIPYMHALRNFEKGDKRYDATFMKTLLVKKEWDIKNGFKDEKASLSATISLSTKMAVKLTAKW